MSVVYLSREAAEKLNQENIEKLLERKEAAQRYQKLIDYYLGRHAILLHQPSDTALPNNRVVNNLCRYITDTATGYFIGNPIAYSSLDPEFLEILQEIFDYNDEQDENAELAKKASIYGHCYEMLYCDEEGNIRFSLVEPGSLTMLYQDGYEEPLAAIRRVESTDLDDKVTVYVEHWSSTTVQKYHGEKRKKLQLDSTEEHHWGDVPFVEYVNNLERVGDFEGIITQNDSYNTVQSNTANIFQYNDEAILTVTGLGDVSSNDVKEMKQGGAIILEEAGEIDWLTKDMDDSALENFKNRLNNDIHQLANVPNMADEKFSGNASGVAMDYKLWGMEQLRGNKERKFKKGLQRRIELIARLLSTPNKPYNYLDIKMRFRANKPQNLKELSEIATSLPGLVSKKTLLQLLPFVEDVQAELEQQEAEKKADVASFGSYDNVLGALEGLKETDEEETADAPENSPETEVKETEPKEAEAPAAAPVEGEETIAKVSLNGAQIQSLLSIVQSVMDGLLTYAAAIALITVSFPFDDATAREILGDEEYLKKKLKGAANDPAGTQPTD